MKNKNIVVLGQQDWESAIGSNNINIAREFARHNKVLYVDNAPDRNTIRTAGSDPLLQKKLKFVQQKKNGVEKVQDNLWVLYPAAIMESINWLPEGFVYRQLNKRNNKLLATCIKAAAAELGFDNFVLFNDSLISKGLHQKEILQPEAYIYYSRDNFSSIPYFQKHALREERELVAKADLVVTNSPQLADIARKHNPNAHNIGQGCDLSLYNPAQTTTPAEMAAIKGPIIGYTGFLTSMRLDIELLAYTAEQHPEWSLVLIGPEDDDFKNSRLHQISNVHFLGNRKPEDLGHYIGSFDVAINPQLLNELTRGNYPRKIDEYLAMGKPVVATKTDFMDFFKEYCYLAEGKESFVRCLEQALAEDTPERHVQRIAFAHTHSWEMNVEQIYKLATAVL